MIFFPNGNNMMMPPNNFENNFNNTINNNLLNKLNEIDNRIKKLEQRIVKLENENGSINYNEPDNSLYMI